MASRTSNWVEVKPVVSMIWGRGVVEKWHLMLVRGLKSLGCTARRKGNTASLGMISDVCCLHCYLDATLFC